MKQLWSGRFKESLDDLMLRFSASIGYDRRLYAYDIQGSIVDLQRLGEVFFQMCCDAFH